MPGQASLLNFGPYFRSFACPQNLLESRPLPFQLLSLERLISPFFFTNSFSVNPLPRKFSPTLKTFRGASPWHFGQKSQYAQPHSSIVVSPLGTLIGLAHRAPISTPPKNFTPSEPYNKPTKFCLKAFIPVLLTLPQGCSLETVIKNFLSSIFLCMIGSEHTQAVRLSFFPLECFLRFPPSLLSSSLPRQDGLVGPTARYSFPLLFTHRSRRGFFSDVDVLPGKSLVFLCSRPKAAFSTGIEIGRNTDPCRTRFCRHRVSVVRCSGTSGETPHLALVVVARGCFSKICFLFRVITRGFNVCVFVFPLPRWISSGWGTQHVVAQILFFSSLPSFQSLVRGNSCSPRAKNACALTFPLSRCRAFFLSKNPLPRLVHRCAGLWEFLCPGPNSFYTSGLPSAR